MATRNRQERAALEDRIAALETELAALRRRVDRMEGGELRVLRAAPFDGRARARPTTGGPRCPSCRLPLDAPAARCPWCSLPFDVLPPRFRPVFSPPPPRKAASKRLQAGAPPRRRAAGGNSRGGRVSKRP